MWTGIEIHSMAQSMQIVFDNRGGDVRTMETVKDFLRFQLTFNERPSDIHLSNSKVRIESELTAEKRVQRKVRRKGELTREDITVWKEVFFR